MCVDSEKGNIYLHGGWDGMKNLDDYWEYNIANNRWRLLSQHTSQDKNGPGPRACHKMLFDQKTGCIYLLGKLGDEEGSRLISEDTPEPRPPGAGEQQFSSEFYRYRTRGIDRGNWELLNFDTAVCFLLHSLQGHLELHVDLRWTTTFIRPPTRDRQRIPDHLRVRGEGCRWREGPNQVFRVLQLQRFYQQMEKLTVC